MYTKEEVEKFGTYLLSEARTKRVEFTNPHDSTLREKLLTVSDDDFLGAFPETIIVLTAQDFVNNPELSEVADEAGAPLQEGDEISIPTAPHVTFDVPEAPTEGTYQAPSEN